MRVVFFGCTKFSEELLNYLLGSVKSIEVVGIFSIPEKFDISYSEGKVTNSNYANLKPVSQVNNIPFFEVDSEVGKRTSDYYDIIKVLSPDVILVLGWYYMVPKSIREIPSLGAWGIHASLLPKYAGGAPLVWAIIEGQKVTGITLFRMEAGVDDGDIIAQKKITIESNESIKEVYEKATLASKEVLKNVFDDVSNITFTKQDKDKIEIYPQRKPSDGEIDWSSEPERIRNFIRAQTKPYPGAFTIINGKKIIIWDADIESI